MLARVRRNYAPVGGEDKTEIPDDDRAWGLMPLASYRNMVERTYERDYRPRFTKLGVDVESAWDAALKLGAAPRKG